MAALTVTAAQVLPDTTGETKTGIAGVAITAGQAVYYDSSANTWKLADADALATVKEGFNCGIAVSEAAAATQHITVQVSGSPTIGAGAAPAAGQTYAVHTTAGGIGLESDPTTGDFLCILGVGSGTNQITLGANGTILGQTAHA